MKDYKNYNINMKGKKTTDCVVRAIATATGLEIEDVAQDLMDEYLKSGYFVDDKRNYEKVLARYGWIKMSQPKKYNGTKYLVGEIDELTKGNAIISCAHHLTCCVGDAVIDLWDCRYKTIGNYYIPTQDCAMVNDKDVLIAPIKRKRLL